MWTWDSLKRRSTTRENGFRASTFRVCALDVDEDAGSMASVIRAWHSRHAAAVERFPSVMRRGSG